MKTITLEELRKVKVGDKVKIVREQPSSTVRLGWAYPSCGNEGMDAFLGKVCTVKSIDTDSAGLPIIRLVEDTERYSWTEGMIEKVIPQEHCASDPFDPFIKLIGGMLKDALKSREQFNFVKAIEKVIYNKPATIIIWADGTKTTAKCADNEPFDPEKGLVICALKKFVKTEELMNLLKFTREGNGTVTYKDVLNLDRNRRCKAGQGKTVVAEKMAKELGLVINKSKKIKKTAKK